MFGGELQGNITKNLAESRNEAMTAADTTRAR